MDCVIWNAMKWTETNAPMARLPPVSWPQTKVVSTHRSPRAEFQLALVSLEPLGIPVTLSYLQGLQQLRTQGDPRLVPSLWGRAKHNRSKWKHSSQSPLWKSVVLDQKHCICRKCPKLGMKLTDVTPQFPLTGGLLSLGTSSNSLTIMSTTFVWSGTFSLS